MGTTWVGALARAATALARGRRVPEGDESDVTDESGFTLIELMVVLLIMGILMAIAIPTFLGVTSTANDTSTQSNLTNVITAAKAIYAKADGYPPSATMVTQLAASEPEMKFVKTTVASAEQKTISVYTDGTTSVTATGVTTPGANGTKLIVAAYMTKTDVCWVAEDTGAGIKFGFGAFGGTGTKTPPGQTKCKAATFSATAAPTATKWPTAPSGH